MKRKILITIVVIFIAIISGCTIYVNDYYHTDTNAIAAFSETGQQTVLKNNTIIYESPDTDTGFIFYPGGKVEYTAYEPLMRSLASEGIMCALIEMPFNLAVLDADAAADIVATYPEIKHWYVGGHSLGGSMAASFVSGNTSVFDGLIMLAAYSTADLSNTDIKVLSIRGSEDQILNVDKYNESISNLPDDFTEVIIYGGNHAGFGMYGTQDGDGQASISNENQIMQTAEAINMFVNK